MARAIPVPARKKSAAAVAKNMVQNEPHLEKMAEMPTRTVKARVASVAMYMTDIALLALLYASKLSFSPVERSDSMSTPVVFKSRPQMSVILKSNMKLGELQLAYMSLPFHWQ